MKKVLSVFVLGFSLFVSSAYAVDALQFPEGCPSVGGVVQCTPTNVNLADLLLVPTVAIGTTNFAPDSCFTGSDGDQYCLTKTVKQPLCNSKSCSDIDDRLNLINQTQVALKQLDNFTRNMYGEQSSIVATTLLWKALSLSDNYLTFTHPEIISDSDLKSLSTYGSDKIFRFRTKVNGIPYVLSLNFEREFVDTTKWINFKSNK
jgi:hypothetical protein